jgi:hypothetical protein
LGDLPNSQVIVEQNAATAFFLHFMMVRLGAPANQGFLIAPA